MSGQETHACAMRRGQDFPVLVLSQDYELFFQNSGSIDKCLFEPTNLLLDYAAKTGLRVTFFVDAGMLATMQRLSPAHPRLARDRSSIQRHVASLHAAGHEIGLHIHPHWEDTRWADDAWDFSGTRYQLKEFAAGEVTDIVNRYATILNELCDGTVTSYRAGGFCVEPFGLLRDALKENGVLTDSSIVPGAVLKDKSKGFDFRRVPNRAWWSFDESPRSEAADGDFLEIPITAVTLPPLHYWGRAIDRIRGRQPGGVIGDGSAKALGRQEILRRLGGAGRVSELSIDVAKAGQLQSRRVLKDNRDVWQIMGHPKLLGQPSLQALSEFTERKNINRFETLASLAAAIRAGELQERRA